MPSARSSALRRVRLAALAAVALAVLITVVATSTGGLDGDTIVARASAAVDPRGQLVYAEFARIGEAPAGPHQDLYRSPGLTAPDGRWHGFVYDARGRLVFESAGEPDGTQRFYDPRSKTIRVVRPRSDVPAAPGDLGPTALFPESLREMRLAGPGRFEGRPTYRLTNGDRSIEIEVDRETYRPRLLVTREVGVTPAPPPERFEVVAYRRVRPGRATERNLRLQPRPGARIVTDEIPIPEARP